MAFFDFEVEKQSIYSAVSIQYTALFQAVIKPKYVFYIQQPTLRASVFLGIGSHALHCCNNIPRPSSGWKHISKHVYILSIRVQHLVGLSSLRWYLRARGTVGFYELDFTLYWQLPSAVMGRGDGILSSDSMDSSEDTWVRLTTLTANIPRADVSIWATHPGSFGRERRGNRHCAANLKYKMQQKWLHVKFGVCLWTVNETSLLFPSVTGLKANMYLKPSILKVPPLLQDWTLLDVAGAGNWVLWGNRSVFSRQTGFLLVDLGLLSCIGHWILSWPCRVGQHRESLHLFLNVRTACPSSAPDRVPKGIHCMVRTPASR